MIPEDRELDPHERLCLRLGILYDQHDQDFGIIHADPNRIFEFIQLFWQWNIQDYGRELLFELIFASFDELLQADPELEIACKAEAKINDVYCASPDRFQLELQYWAKWDFDASSTARKLLANQPESPDTFCDYWLRGDDTRAGLVLRTAIGPSTFARFSHRLLSGQFIPLDLEKLQLAIESGRWSHSNELYLAIRKQRVAEPDPRDARAIERATFLQMLENVALMHCEAWQKLPQSPQNPDLEFLRGFASLHCARSLANHHSLETIKSVLQELA